MMAILYDRILQMHNVMIHFQLPRDGKTAGRLKIRGNWVLESYYKSDKANLQVTYTWM